MPSASRARASVSRLRMFRSMRRRRISRNVFWLATRSPLRSAFFWADHRASKLLHGGGAAGADVDHLVLRLRLRLPGGGSGRREGKGGDDGCSHAPPARVRAT